MTETMPVADRERRIQELSAQIEAMEDIYQEAVDAEAGNNEAWNVQRRVLEQTICDGILSFSPDDPATKAVFILGRLAEKANRMVAYKAIIRDHARMKKQLESLQIERDIEAKYGPAQPSLSAQALDGPNPRRTEEGP